MQAKITDYGSAVTPRAVDQQAASAVRVLPRSADAGEAEAAVRPASDAPRPVRQSAVAAVTEAPTGPTPRDVAGEAEAAISRVGYDGPNPETGGVWTHPELVDAPGRGGQTRYTAD
jgi:hypothetical protein